MGACHAGLGSYRVMKTNRHRGKLHTPRCKSAPTQANTALLSAEKRSVGNPDVSPLRASLVVYFTVVKGLSAHVSGKHIKLRGETQLIRCYFFPSPSTRCILKKCAYPYRSHKTPLAHLRYVTGRLSLANVPVLYNISCTSGGRLVVKLSV